MPLCHTPVNEMVLEGHSDRTLHPHNTFNLLRTATTVNNTPRDTWCGSRWGGAQLPGSPIPTTCGGTSDTAE